MSNDLDLVFFMTNLGHHGRYDLYKYTLNNLKKNTHNLFTFSNKFLSIKDFSKGEDTSGIVKHFSEFNVFVNKNSDHNIQKDAPYNNYGYYLLNNYLADIANCYLRLKDIPHSKYAYLVEDDSPEILLSASFSNFVDQAIKKLESDPNIFSIHLKRENLESAANLNGDINKDFFIDSQNNDYNFQNQIFRIDDMVKVSEIIRDNYNSLSPIHTERAVRTAIYSLNPKFRFVYCNSNFAYSTHIGVSNSEEYIKYFNL